MVIQKIHSRNTKPKGITRVERNYKGRKELQGSKGITRAKQITSVETNYEDRNKLQVTNYVSIRELYYIYLNIIYVL